MNKIIPLSLMGAILMATMPTTSKNDYILNKEYQSKNKITIKADMEYFKKLEEQKQEEIRKQQEIERQSSYTTRMTSYYPEEGENRTGSGLTPANFGINEHGWYTYQGKLVVATATTYLANQGWNTGDVHLRKYYDELTLNIDGTDYEAIVLDSCGNCMTTDRIDLYVSSANSVKDTMIEVKE